MKLLALRACVQMARYVWARRFFENYGDPNTESWLEARNFINQGLPDRTCDIVLGFEFRELRDLDDHLQKLYGAGL